MLTPPIPRPGSTSAQSQRILVIEDNRETRQWIAETLLATLPGRVIAQAATCAEARETLFGPAAQPPGLVLVDLDLPDGRGIDLIREIRQARSETLAIVITIFEDDQSVFDALAAGADGYILKGVRSEALADQFRRIEQGEPAISPRIAQRMMAHFRNMPPVIAHKEGQMVALTAREQEVLRLIARGLTMVEIAAALGISQNTCATHTKAIYRKLDISSRAQAALAAERRGLV